MVVIASNLLEAYEYFPDLENDKRSADSNLPAYQRTPLQYPELDREDPSVGSSTESGSADGRLLLASHGGDKPRTSLAEIRWLNASS